MPTYGFQFACFAQVSRLAYYDGVGVEPASLKQTTHKVETHSGVSGGHFKTTALSFFRQAKSIWTLPSLRFHSRGHLYQARHNLRKAPERAAFLSQFQDCLQLLPSRFPLLHFLRGSVFLHEPVAWLLTSQHLFELLLGLLMRQEGHIYIYIYRRDYVS